MRLRRQALEVVDETLATVLGILVVPSEVDRLLRADFLAVAAEDAPELINLEHERKAIPFLVFARHELDAVGRADLRAEPTRDALRLSRLVREHPVRAAPARRERPLHLRILLRLLVRIHEVLEGQR